MKGFDLACLIGGLLALAGGTAAAVAAVRTGSPRLMALVRGAAAFGTLFHLALLAAVGIREGHFPVAGSFEAFVFLSAAMCAAALLLDFLRAMPILLVATLPLAFLTSLLALTFSMAPEGAAAPGLTSPGIALHVTGSLGSYAAFALAFASGIVYVVAQRQLKGRAPSPVLGLMPALETVARVNVRAIAAGVLLLAAGLVAGYLYARSLYPGERGWRVDPKVFLTTATVLVYAAVLALSRRPAFKGRRTALASVAGFALVLATFWANVFWSGFHRF